MSRLRVLTPRQVIAENLSSRPPNDRVAVAVFLGVILGALGGGFALGMLVITTTLAAIGVWRAVLLLAIIADALTELPVSGPAGDPNATVRMHTR